MKEERSAERALVEEANSALSKAMQLQKAAEDEKEKKAKVCGNDGPLLLVVTHSLCSHLIC
jgi:hypothetical protein